MVRFMLIVAAASTLTLSCDQKVLKLEEPSRTGFFFQCIQLERNVSVCECMEKAVVEATGITVVETQEVANSFVATYNNLRQSGACSEYKKNQTSDK